MENINNNIKNEPQEEKNLIRIENSNQNKPTTIIQIKNKKEKGKKYKIKFSVLISKLRGFSDKKDKMNFVEFTSNLLLMSSEINQTNKISCLTVLSYINYVRENALYTYYLNKKIFKYLKIQKSIESFIYIRTLYRAAYFLEKENNLFHAKKYVAEAENLSKNSKIDADSTNMLNNIKRKIEKGINGYLNLYVKKFREIDESDNLNDENYMKMKILFKALKENTYNSLPKSNNNNSDDNYLYLINKNWFIKAYNFFVDYCKVRDSFIKGNYFATAFYQDYCYYKYFDLSEELKKCNFKYRPFPGYIDNYSIINWKDNWFDPLNEDENFILKDNLKEGKDFYILEKSDFIFLQKFFGVTNVIKRKKDCFNFIEIKAIILDKKLKEKENNFILKRRNLQVRNNYTIEDLKNKIIRCINDTIEKNKEKKILMFETKENKEEQKMDIEEDIKEYYIHFYLLEKEKKDILMEICISYVNELPKYENIYLKKLNLTEVDSITKLLSEYNKNKSILIIELQEQNSPLFINQIEMSGNNKYICSVCNKEINLLNTAYKCNICNYSLFCSEECANIEETHNKLDELYLSEYLYEEFDLKSFLKKNISDLPMLLPESSKGMVGLLNLGNTCYINSSIQCLSNTCDLTKYFLLEYFRNDINTGNKLGSNGNVSLKYYELIKLMWCGNENKISPKDFIISFKKLKKQFEGYRQQDAQEFLSVLLDQLHEDLNRITDKPYIELLEKQDNEDDLKASKRWWDLHKKREDSIIVDLFNGQFKSETICQVCGKSSITYDPFMSLCLPLPSPKKHSIIKIFCDMECKYFEFQSDERTTIADLKKQAMNFIAPLIEDSKYLDLELVVLDENKSIINILSTDIKDNNYKGQTLLSKLLVKKNELVFFKKRANLDEKYYMNFYIYPIKPQKPDKDYVYYNHFIPMKYLSYPLFFQIRNDTSVEDFCNIVYNRINSLNFFIQERQSLFFKNKQYNKILELNIIHGEETKKTGILALFSMEETCKFCGEYNKFNYYCPINKLGDKHNSIKENFKNLKKPVILVATSECYNLRGEGQVYLECPLLINQTQSDNLENFYSNTILKDCFEMLVKNENYQDDESWFCSHCKKLQKSRQKLQIYKPPNYLIILLKRYDLKKNYGNNMYLGEKNNTYVMYPINNFDIREYIVGPEKDLAIYDLYGVIEHYGTLSQGHYKALCKNDNNWISYNDSIIDIVKDPLSKNAYVLFYKMKNLEEKMK